MVWPTRSDANINDFNPADFPGYNIKSAFADSFANHILNLDLKASPGCVRLTAICATIGKQTKSQEIIEQMIEAGMNIAIINMDYDSVEEHIETIKMLRTAAKEVGVKRGYTYPLGIAARLTGKNIKTGKITESCGDTVEIKTGESVRLTSDETYRERCSEHTIFADFINLGDYLNTGQTVLIDNERILLKILIISSTTVTCLVERGGSLGSFKDVYIPNATFSIGDFLEKDKQDIEMLLKQQFNPADFPGYNIKSAFADSFANHILNLDLKASPGCVRLTAICATIGKQTKSQEIIEQMIEAGMNIAIINMDYDSVEEHIETIKMLRTAAKEVGVKRGYTYPLGIAARLTGKNIKTGKITESCGDTVEIKTGESVRLTSDETYRERCSEHTIFADFINLGDYLNTGQTVLIDNERILLKILIISSTTVTCLVERGGSLGSFKDVYIPNATFSIGDFLEKDKQDIEMLLKQQVDIIIPPFVRHPETIKELRTILGEKGKKIAIVAKIQNKEGFENIDEILKVADGVCISRLELGSDISPQKLLLVQRKLIMKANIANKPVLVSAQLLNSMKDERIPVRSEYLDIANAVLDGADGLVLSSETAIGLYPIEAITVMADVCREAEACSWTRKVYLDMIMKTPRPCDQVTATAIAAMLASCRSIAAAIIVVTTTGRSAFLVTKYRPRCPVLAITRYPQIAKQMHLYRGIVPLVYEDNPESDWNLDLSKRTSFAIRFGLDHGFMKIGDPVVMVYGWKRGTGNTNTMKMTYASLDNTI